jgi:hypothetical protein
MEYEGFSLYFNVLPRLNKVSRFLFLDFFGVGKYNGAEGIISSKKE